MKESLQLLLLIVGRQTCVYLITVAWSLQLPSRSIHICIEPWESMPGADSIHRQRVLSATGRARQDRVTLYTHIHAALSFMLPKFPRLMRIEAQSFASYTILKVRAFIRGTSGRYGVGCDHTCSRVMSAARYDASVAAIDASVTALQRSETSCEPFEAVCGSHGELDFRAMTTVSLCSSSLCQGQHEA